MRARVEDFPDVVAELRTGLSADCWQGQPGASFSRGVECAAACGQAAQVREELIAGGNWTALDLPTPEALLEGLMVGDSVEVDGYRLDYEYGMVWFKDPQGVFGCLGPRLDVYTMQDFLEQLARGHVFGMVAS